VSAASAIPGASLVEGEHDLGFGTSLLDTIFAAAVTSYLAGHLAAARIGRPA
jgi:hypothetical protein